MRCHRTGRKTGGHIPQREGHVLQRSRVRICQRSRQRAGRPLSSGSTRSEQDDDDQQTRREEELSSELHFHADQLAVKERRSQWDRPCPSAELGARPGQNGKPICIQPHFPCSELGSNCKQLSGKLKVTGRTSAGAEHGGTPRSLRWQVDRLIRRVRVNWQPARPPERHML